MKDKAFMTLAEAAACFGVSVRTVQRLVASGRVTAVYTGEKQKRARYITREEIERVLRKGV